MKFNSPVSWLGKIFAGERKAEKLRLLQQQRMLLHQGLEATAEVMDTTLFDDKVGSMFLVKLWLKLKKADGSFIYTHTHSLVSFGHIPGKGQLLRIKYLPENLSAILIL
jgi:hypothetical protein